MDRLLEKLRQNMAELSVQGDDFTRQIWHMYATFEEFIDTHTNFGTEKQGEGGGSPSGAESYQDDRDCVGDVPVGAVNRKSLPGTGSPGTRAHVLSSLERGNREGMAGATASPGPSQSAPSNISPLACVPSSSMVQSSLEFPFDSGDAGAQGDSSKCGNSKDDLSLLYRRSHHRCRYRRSRKRLDIANPLLETISAIQDLCESDEYGEMPPYYGTHRVPARSYPEGDKDSIGYAGSNSIDSGYKSSCPTPDLSDTAYYSHEAGNKRGSIASQGSPKPRIPMGTKVMNRHSHPQCPSRGGLGGGGGMVGMMSMGGAGCDPGIRRIGEASYYDVDLDHLMYLRQSILSAMQRYERVADDVGQRNRSPQDAPLASAPTASPTAPAFPALGTSARQRSKSPMELGFRPRSASASSRTGSSPGSPKRSSSGYRSASPGGTGSSPLAQRRSLSPLCSGRGVPMSTVRTESSPVHGRASYPGSRTHSPCYSSASNGSGKSSPGYQKSIACRLGSHRLEMVGAPSMKGMGALPRSLISGTPASRSIGMSPDESTLEEDIDTLLYGRSECQDLENREEFPCSYVTMIEDKYRRSSVARVKKLREKRETPESSSGSDSSCASPTRRQPPLPPPPPPHQSSRFSEVAKCMLEIIEDLQTQHATQPSLTTESTRLRDPSRPAPSSSRASPPAPAPPEPTAQQEAAAAASSDATTAKERRGGRAEGRGATPRAIQMPPGGDYHVYEEIMYELTSPKEEPGPPPLPARPSGIFRWRGKGVGAPPRPRAAHPPPAVPSAPLAPPSTAAAAPSAPTEGCRQVEANTPAANKPKQRSNLYSLFTEKSARRSISQSLEKEFQEGGGLGEGRRGDDDEYGFHN